MIQKQYLHPTTRHRRKHWSLLNVVLIGLTALLIIAGLAILFFIGQGRFQVEATPTTFSQGLEEIKVEIARQLRAGVPEPSAHLVLQPGIYMGPIILDESCSMITIQASGPGVRIIPSSGSQHLPLILCRSGARNIHIHGLTLDQSGQTAVEIQANAVVTLSALRVEHAEGSVLDISGTATVRGLRARGFASGILVRPGAQLAMRDSVLAGSGVHFDINQGHVQLQNCRLQQLGEQSTTSLLSANGGELRLENTIVSAPASEIAISLDRVRSVQMQNVSVEASLIGMRSHDSRVTMVSGLSIQAEKVGLHWTGPWDLSWNWSGQLLTAPTPIEGEALRGLPYQEDGANKQLIEQVPALDGI